jgi:phosphatidylinositol alpha-mannosyltransferase
MKIAVYHSTLPNPRRAKEGGVSYVVHQLANTFARRGHDLTVFSFDPAPADALYTVTRLPLGAWGESTIGRISLAPLLLNGLDLRHFDVMHTHGDDHFVFRRPLPWVRTLHGSAKREFASAVRLRRRLSQSVLIPLESLSCRAADIAVGVSRDTAVCLPAVDDVIANGVDTELFCPSSHPRSAVPSILFVGTVHGRKRGGLLLRLFQEHIRPHHPEAELWMVCEPGPPMAGVRWLGKVSTEQLAQLYQQAWVFCLPSSYEGFGVPYIEALACGAPVVASPNPGARAVLDEGRYGILASDDELSPALLSLLRDAELRQRLADTGLSRAAEYRWDTIAARYERVYERAQGVYQRLT